MSNKGYALVTGATGGLGKAFVYTLAEEGYSLILTGRSQRKLEELQREIQTQYNSLDVLYYPTDIAEEEGRARLMNWVMDKKIPLTLLANVAGVDIQKGVEVYDQRKVRLQCRVNFEAAVDLCRFAIQNRGERLEIVNVSSVSGIYPMPYFAIYSATKSALTSFSVSLREEMKGKNVAVTVVLPGAMPTRPDICKQIQGQGIWGKLAVMDPKRVAEGSLRAVHRNRRKVIIGFWNKAMRFFTCLLPTSWRLAFIAKRWSKISKDAF